MVQPATPRTNASKVAGFVLGKGKREEEGGDEPRVATEETLKVEGRTLGLRLSRHTRRPAPANSHPTRHLLRGIPFR